MTSSKSTKRALIFSALAILMCVAMLIGTTFAWFTDTASTGVNKIQAGNLDVKLMYSTDMVNWKEATFIFCLMHSFCHQYILCLPTDFRHKIRFGLWKQ